MHLRILLTLALVGCPYAYSQDLKIGFAAEDITPPVGYRMAGNYQEKFSTGVHDPLYAKAMVVECDGVTWGLLCCDVCNVARDLTDAIRAGAAKTLGVPVSQLSVSATHTHAGPLHADPVLRVLFRERAGAKSDDDDPKELGQYRKTFIANGTKALETAFRNRRKATLEFGETTLAGVAFNRRFHMKDGTVRFNPGKMNPGIVRTAGLVNDAVPFVMAVDSASGKPFGSFCTFDMHVAVFGGTKYGACYPGELQKRLRKDYGEDFISVFGEGCAGDINHVNVAKKEKDLNSEDIGQKLGDVIVAAKREKITKPTLRAKNAFVPVPLKPRRVDELPKMRDRLIGKDFAKVPFLESVEATQVHMTEHLFHRDGDPAKLEIHAFQLSADTAIVTLPHEIFVELGLAIKKQSPYQHTFVVTLANDVDVYVPTRKAFGEGSYEVTNSPYAPGVGERLVDGAVALLKDLKK